MSSKDHGQDNSRKQEESLHRVNLNMRKLRIQAGMTQRELGEKIGLDHRSISAYENGHYEPGASVIIKYCDVFHTTPDELLGYHSHEENAGWHLSEEEVKMIMAYRRRPEYVQTSVKTLCLHGMKYLSEEEDIRQDMEWVENRKRQMKIQKNMEKWARNAKKASDLKGKE
ncbi:MAG: helix-turn-helix transcriptional regulator [Lactimicrobium sp.]|jgi:transcriptional regulator with XRE-family HTH domain|uniref:helix-turn-helix domain-containing protein n=1 Tax=Lactimicrobium sp. TaxID=2563780 RepID=UPI002F360966